MNKKNKKTLHKTFLTLGLFLPLFLSGVSTSNQDFTLKHDSLLTTKTKSIASDNLKSDIDSLDFAINLYDETINYDIKFKNNAFNGTKVSSFFYYAYGQDQWFGVWDKVTFENSTETVANRRASNKTNYHDQLSSLLVDNDNHIFNDDGKISVGVAYEKNGEMVSATNNWVNFNIFDDSIINMNQENTAMFINEDQTFAEINFDLKFDKTKMSPDVIFLKSHSDSNLEQSIFKQGEYNLIQGKNKINIRLKNEYEYKDLYLEFVFDNFGDGHYLFNSDFDSSIDFVSGDLGGWNATSISLLVITLLLVIVMIVFIFLLLKLIRRRRELEQLSKQNYYDNHFE